MILHLLGAFTASFIAGAINSVAGGGTMISFPVLLALGVPPLMANATNTVGIWPGAIGSVWGFRAEFTKIPKIYHWLLAPAFIGSGIGAILLRHTSAQLFARVVPALLLFATVMFIIAPSVRERLKHKTQMEAHGALKLFLVFILQTGIAVYGGYFGAGMGILTLSVLGIIGMTDMLEMTAMTSFLALAINGLAGLIFAFTGLVDWPYAGAMAVGAILGGYGATGLARKVGGIWIRRLVIAIGLALAFTMLLRLR